MPPRRRNSPQCTRNREAPTSTPAVSSPRCGGTSPDGASSSARPRRVSRWRSPPGLPVARTRPTRRRRGGRRRRRRQHRRAVAHRRRHQVPADRRARRPRLGRGRRLVQPEACLAVHRSDRHHRRSACFAPPASCSSPSPATPASPRSARKSATPPSPSPRRSRAPRRRTRHLRDRRRHAARHRADRRDRDERRSTRPRRAAPASSGSSPDRPHRAGIAALGVLLNLIPGISRTMLAMARRHELPAWLATRRTRSIPLRAEAAVTAVVIALTATLDLRGAIGFSGVTILTYYAITNAAASPCRATAPLAPMGRRRGSRRLPHPRGHATARGDRHRYRHLALGVILGRRARRTRPATIG